MSGVNSRTSEAKRGLPADPQDSADMALAIALGKRGLGQCWPNPSVGAVIVEPGSGRIVGSGWTSRGGRPHAEVNALAEAGEAARGATLYATLEPCAHWGKTPPCSDAVIAAGISRVVYGVIDPDPRVAGQGLARMRSRGIEVAESGLTREARWLALGHELRITAQRPFIQLKFALDAAGMVPAGDGAPVWATGAEARARGHLMRAEADAILIGHGTVAADDPELTCRLPGLEHRSPVRVVLSSRAELPASARMLRTLELAPVWVLHGAGAPRDNRERLTAAGAECLETETGPDGRLDIRAVAAMLAQRGITRLLVEGGPQVAESFLKAGLADEVALFQSDKRLTGAAIQPSGLELLAGTPDFTLYEQRPIGADRMIVHRRTHYWQS